MPLFYPHLYKNSICDLTAQELRGLGVTCLILDVDNTLQEHHAGTPAEGVSQWLKEMKDEGFSLCIASNSKDHRVSAFAKKVDLPYESLCCKPFPFGLRRSAEKMGVDRRQCLMVGDQIFTDLIAAKTAGMKMLLLRPIKPEEGRSFRIRRWLEKKIMKKYPAYIERKKK